MLSWAFMTLVLTMMASRKQNKGLGSIRSSRSPTLEPRLGLGFQRGPGGRALTQSARQDSGLTTKLGPNSCRLMNPQGLGSYGTAGSQGQDLNHQSMEWNVTSQGGLTWSCSPPRTAWILEPTSLRGSSFLWHYLPCLVGLLIAPQPPHVGVYPCDLEGRVPATPDW